MSEIERLVTRGTDVKVDKLPWGRLIWTLTREQGNAGEMTLGRCLIDEGHENGRHLHPNCEEVLSVRTGTIVHTVGDEEITMRDGDTIRVPPGVVHNARNVGKGVADLLIVFSSGDRRTIDA
ncbi:MAG TPA: cupin domain-containing protein [Solirubrobacter sp.]|nr:cupin domain-containing protein [Solirubrobacter sp.]